MSESDPRIWAEYYVLIHKKVLISWCVHRFSESEQSGVINSMY